MRNERHSWYSRIIKHLKYLPNQYLKYRSGIIFFSRNVLLDLKTLHTFLVPSMTRPTRMCGGIPAKHPYDRHNQLVARQRRRSTLVANPRPTWLALSQQTSLLRLCSKRM